MNDEYSQAFLDLLRPGQTLRIYYGPANINNKRLHVRAIVDGEIVVYRVWSRRHGWIYQVENRGSLHWQWQKGILRLA